MRLMECLNDADVLTLRKIVDHYGFSCSRHSKMDMIQEISLTFRSSRFLGQYLPMWTDGREFPLLRLCVSAVRPLTGEEIDGVFCDVDSNILDSALREGWLFSTTRIDGRRLYVMPDELKRVMQERLTACVLASVQQRAEGPAVFAEEGYALSHDLDVFLEYVDHHDVLLTQGGSMYKRHLVQVLQILEVEEDVLSGGWRFGYGRRFHDYPDRFALLYDFAYHAGYLEESADGRLRTRPEREEWMSMKPVQRQRAFFRFYLSSYRRPILRLPVLTQVIGWVPPRWIHSDSMFQALEPLINEYYYDTKEQVWKTRIVKMLTHLGILRTGEDDLGRQWFQITKLGQELLTPDAIPAADPQEDDSRRVLIVQPNFDILVTAETPRLAAVLAQFADLKQSGTLRVYGMSKSSLERGIREGGTISGWLEFLTQYSQTPVPGNVERTLREWEQPLQGGGNGEEISLGLKPIELARDQDIQQKSGQERSG